MQPRSIMEEFVKRGPKIPKPILVDYIGLDSKILKRERLLISRELERIGLHIADLEDHIARLREYQSELFRRKDKIERQIVPTLVIGLKTKKKEKATIVNKILEAHSLSAIEIILQRAKAKGRI